MLTSLSIIVIGFFLGMRHATDPDHVIAVSTIVTRQHSTGRAAMIGVLWGVGHTVTIFAVGTAIILFNVVIPSRLGLSMELSVSLLLILLGGWNIWDFLRNRDHFHWCSSDLPVLPLDYRLSKVGRRQFLRPLIVGIVHGLAGSAAIALLVLASIGNSMLGIAYLLIFGTGTIGGMMLITVSIASTLRHAASRFRRFNQHLAMASGLISLVFGLFVTYQICVSQGLLTAHPHWSPR